jgi:hypothetical protein
VKFLLLGLFAISMSTSAMSASDCSRKETAEAKVNRYWKSGYGTVEMCRLLPKDEQLNCRQQLTNTGRWTQIETELRLAKPSDKIRLRALCEDIRQLIPERGIRCDL